MGPRQYTFSLVAVIIYCNLGCFVFGNTDKLEDEDLKYIAQDDLENMKNRLRMFGAEYGKSWIVMPDGNEMAQFAILENLGPYERPQSANSLRGIDESVKLYVFTKQYPQGKELDLENLSDSFITPKKPVKMIIHGWKSGVNTSTVRGIKDAYLEYLDVNVIGVDWSVITDDIFYPTPAQETRKVGQYLAKAIELMVNQFDFKYSDFHLIGHSLGAHVAGFAGSATKQKVGRITGLDPALPGFQFAKGPKDRLDPSDANFVDVIHTCAGLLGMSLRVGHTDFFPNGGSPFQPGCLDDSVLPTSIQICSHGRSHKYFAESIKSNAFKAINCSNWYHFKKHKCKKQLINMGEYVSQKQNGVFYLKTDSSAPFALGYKGTVY